MSQEATTEINYKETLNLPETEFKMKAGAATREPEIETMWDEQQIYEKSVAMRDKQKKFILHDGPPYLSSDKIHIGTALNKILKDIVTRYKFQRGYYSPYVPGYDSHGLPIENAVVKNIKGGRKAITEVELRKQCREFALKNLDGQEANFKRLGVWGNWGSPYLTMRAEYEALQAKLFCQMYKDGHVYKGLKPVYWCPTCETALADAEVEYDNHTSHSIYVKFNYSPDPNGIIMQSATDKTGEGFDRYPHLETASFVIWTTTPWTLPANLALSVHPDFNYEVVDYGSEKIVINDELRPMFEKHVSLEKGNVLATFKGHELNLQYAQHPFIKDRQVPVLNGTHVTTEAGTGIVHTAPGHGMEDYVVCTNFDQEFQQLAHKREFLQVLKENKVESNSINSYALNTALEFNLNIEGYKTSTLEELEVSINSIDTKIQKMNKEIGIISPLDNRGVFVEGDYELPSELIGQYYEKVNDIVLDILRENNALLGHRKFDHSYPHCWRCHNPVIYRATDQWFINVNNIRQKALDAIKTVEWIPARGEGRISSMVEGRTDWCISRQRVWGVPIPIFTDKETGETVMTDALVEHIYQKFCEHSSDIWWELSAEDLLQDLPDSAKAEINLNNRTLVKEMDIMDVWFDSGISHTAVVDARKEELGELPVELYLEGSDQHRGWFQSALWTSVMLNGKAPYKSVLTHGFVMDKDGRKMSKSIGNVVDPNKVINQYGADVLRLWVASVDYSVDSRIGDEMLKQLADVYRKIRNTVRFILGNLNGFNPKTDSVSYDEWSELDKYTLHRTQDVVKTLTEAFDRYEFHRYYQVLQNYCVNDLSSLYFDVTKDILYCDAKTSPRRRAVQTVLFELLKTLVPMLVPVMPHMAEDIWQSLPEEHKFADGIDSVVLADWPEVNPQFVNEAAYNRFKEILALKDNVNLALEKPRADGQIGSSLEAGVVIQLSDESKAFLLELDQDELSLLTITSQFCVEREPAPDTEKLLHRLRTDAGYDVVAYKAAGEKCNRCWKFLPSVGTHSDHPGICSRCHEAV